MKRVVRTLAALCLLSVAVAAQVVPVKSKIGLGNGNPNSGKNYLHFELYNCGGNFPIQTDASGGIQTVVSKTFDIVANSQGIAQGQVVGDDQITCGNVPSTQWRVSVLSAQGVPIAGPKRYFICSAAATNQQCSQVAGAGGLFDISNAQPTVTDPPSPGYIQIFGNPLVNQLWKQPTGTTAYFQGTFDFTNANVIGLSGGGGGGGISSLTGTLPISVTVGSAPVISISKSDATHDGYISSSDWNTFNSKGSGSVTSMGITVPQGLAISGCPITSSGTCAISLNGQFPVSSLGTGSPSSLNWLNGSGAWTSPLTYSGSPVTSLVQGSNTALTLTGNALTVNSTSAVTFPVAAPEGSQTAPQYSFALHPEIGIATSLVGHALPIRSVQVTGPVGPNNIIVTLSSPINVLRWNIGDTFRLAALPVTNSLNTLNGVTFTATAVGQTSPTGTVTFSASTSIATATYTPTAGTASNWGGSLDGHTWLFNRLQSSTTNPSRTGTIEGARRDAWKFRAGASDDTGIDIAALRGAAAKNPTSGVGAGIITASGTNSLGASSITVAKGAGADWLAKNGDFILIDTANGDADLQMYKITADTTVTQGTTTSLPITPTLKTNITAGQLIVASWSRTQLGDASGVEILGTIETPGVSDGCWQTVSGIWSTTTCGGGGAVAGADQDVQLNVSGAFGVDTGQFKYDTANRKLTVGTLSFQGKSTVPNQASFTNGAQACTLPGAGKSSWCFDTDGFFKISEGNGAYYRPGSGAGTGNVSNQGTPSAGQSAEWTDATHVTGVAVSGSGNYVKATAPTISAPKLDVINDVNAKALITLVATANAVDGLSVTNAATANPATVTVSASGSDTNISLNFVSKGTGTVQCNGSPCGSGGSSFTNLFQTDANTITQRNATVTQVHQVMDSYTDAANYQGLAIGGFYTKTVKLGTGAAAAYKFGVDAGTFRGWQVTTGMDLVPFNTLTPPNVGLAANRAAGLFAASADFTGAVTVTVLNDTVTGTTVNKLAKLTGAPSKAILTGTSDTDDFEGIVTGGAGLSGSATVARVGFASCVFDAGTVAGDYVQNSATVAGDCRDVGATRPASGKVVGRVQSTNASAGTYAVLMGLDSGGGGGSGAGTVTSISSSGGAPLFSSVVNTPTTTPQIVFSLSSAPANTIYANATAGIAVPNFVAPTLNGSLFSGQGTSTDQVLHANPSGNLSWGLVNASTGLTGNLVVAQFAAGAGATASTVWCGNMTWCTPPGGGNVSVAGTTPVAGQSTEWAGATTIRAVANTGSGNFVRQTSPTLNNPLIPSIKDSSGNPALDFVATPSAVDSATITNAATGAAPAVQYGVQGTDANIDLLLSAKGIGVVRVNGPVITNSLVSLHFGPEGLDPGQCAAGVDGYYASSVNHYLTMCNNGASQQKVIGSGVDINTQDQVIGIHLPSPGAGSVAYNNGSTWTSFAGNTSGTAYLCENSTGVPAWCTSTSGVSWSSLQNPASTTNLTMGAFTTNFNYSSALANSFAWINTTAATLGTAQSSPAIGLQGNYWSSTGPSSSQDNWQIQNVVSSGLDATSTLTFSHNRTGGLVSAPGFSTSQPTALSSLEGSCASVGVAGRDVLCANSTTHAWTMVNNNQTGVPLVGGINGATSGNLVSFNGTSGGLIQDTFIATANVVTSSIPFTNGEVVVAGGSNKTTTSSGILGADLVTAASIIGNGNVPQGNGLKGLSNSGILAANLLTSSANGTTSNIVTYAGNNKTTIDSGVSISNTFHTGTKIDVLTGASYCADSGSNDTYACNLSPAVTAYVTGKTRACFLANTTNTGAASINFNGVGALAIKIPLRGSVTADPLDGDLPAGSINCGTYDGTNFIMTSQPSTTLATFPTPTRAGDVMYWNGSAWVTLAGNNSGTVFLQENGSGVPTWAAGSSTTGLSSLTAATGANTINNGDNAQRWNWAMTTSGQVGMRISENTAATSAGAPWLFQVDSIAASTANIAKFTALGTSNGVGVLKTGFLTSLGTGGIDSVMLYCDVTDKTKCMQLTLSGITTATTRALTIPDAASTAVVADTGSTNNFLTAISATGVISKARPSVANLSDGANVVIAVAPGVGIAHFAGSTQTATSSAVVDADLSGQVGVAHGGTNLASGTSGGILGYTASGTLASSVALTANVLVKGGGAGATPTNSGITDNGTTVSSAEGLAFSGTAGAATTISTSTTNAAMHLAPNGTGQVLLDTDGSVTLPIIAFNSQAGFGLTRQASSTVGITNGSNYFMLLKTGVGVVLPQNSGLSIVNNATDATNSTKNVCWDNPTLSTNIWRMSSSCADAASPVAMTLRGMGSRGGTDSNVSGGDVLFQPGPGTGIAAPSRLRFQAPGDLMASGSTQQTQLDRLVINGTKTLSNTSATATTIFTLTFNSSNRAEGGDVHYEIMVSDGTDWCSLAGTVHFVLVAKAGTRSSATSTPTEVKIASGSACTTLSTTWAFSAGNDSLQVTPTFAAITPTSVKIRYSVFNNGEDSITTF